MQYTQLNTGTELFIGYIHLELITSTEHGSTTQLHLKFVPNKFEVITINS